MAKQYIHESDLWHTEERPKWTWNNTEIIELLAKVRHRQGLLLGSMHSLGFDLRMEASLTALTADIVTSGAIEGEILPDEEVRSSIARHLGLNIGGLIPSSRSIDSFVQIVLDATSHYSKSLSKERLFSWHTLLFQDLSETSYNKISIGEWRKDLRGKMQVISGAIGREKIHYEAPCAGEGAENIEKEMKRFLVWLEKEDRLDLIIKSAIAHLWFVTIHPFDDGNGRIARVISDMLLAQSEQSTERFYSMSSAIERNRTSYYEALQKAQSLNFSEQEKGLDITLWLTWFIKCLEDAISHAHILLEKTLYKAKLWAEANKYPLNKRQELILKKLLDNFEGKLTSTKYAKIAKCSQDSAQRDIKALIEYKILKKSEAGGRSTSYCLF